MIFDTIEHDNRVISFYVKDAFAIIMYHDMSGPTPKLSHVVYPEGDVGGLYAFYVGIKKALSNS